MWITHPVSTPKNSFKTARRAILSFPVPLPSGTKVLVCRLSKNSSASFSVRPALWSANGRIAAPLPPALFRRPIWDRPDPPASRCRLFRRFHLPGRAPLFFLKVSPGRSRASRSPLLCIPPSPAPGRPCKTSPGSFQPENIPYPSPSSPACCESAPLSACTARVLSLKSENKKQEAGLSVPGFLFYFVSPANRFSSCGRGPQKPRPQSAFFLPAASPFALRTKKQGPFCRPCLAAAAVHLTFLNPVCSLSGHPLWVLWFPVPIKIPPCSLFLSETSPIPQRTQPQ